MKLTLIFTTAFLFFSGALASSQIDLKGKVLGFQPTNKQKADLIVGLVLASQPKSSYVDFSIGDFISPKIDELTAVVIFKKSIDIPSNITVPKQKLSPLKIKTKNHFTLPNTSKSLKKMGILHGHVHNALNVITSGDPVFTKLNDITFDSFDLTNIDFESDTNLIMLSHTPTETEHEFLFSNPNDADTEGLLTLGINLHKDQETQTYFPTDLKFLQEGEPQLLKSSLSQESIVLTMPKEIFEAYPKTQKEALSFSMVWGDSQPSKQLPLLTTSIGDKEYGWWHWKTWVGTIFGHEPPETLSFKQADNINDDFFVLGYTIKYIQVDTIKKEKEDQDEEVIQTVVDTHSYISTFPKEIVLEKNSDTFSYNRIQVNVYALDSNPDLRDYTEDQLHTFAKYISRIELDL